MKTWYTTREEQELWHKSTPIGNGKKILLTEDQAKLHGEEKLEKSEPPKDASEAGVAAEYQEWSKDQEETKEEKAETPATEEKTKTKAKPPKKAAEEGA